TVPKIHEILKPQEYTRVDRLVDIIFSTSEDLQADDEIDDIEAKETNAEITHTSKPAAFHNECIQRISSYLSTPLIKEGRSTYKGSNTSARVLSLVSKEYPNKIKNATRYWYAFHPYQKSFLEDHNSSYIALGCGSSQSIL